MCKKRLNNIYFLPNGEPMVDWCRRNNVPPNCVYRQLNMGLLVKDACEEAKRVHEKYLQTQPITYKGKSLHSQFTTLEYTRIFAHIQKGKTVDQAVEDYFYNKAHPHLPTRIKPVFDEKTGKVYSSRNECAKAYGVNPSTITGWVQSENKGLKYLKQEKKCR